MAVTEEEVDIADFIRKKRKASLAQSRARVEDHPVLAAANFYAGGVASISVEFRA
jgi:hypothetical protein